MAKKKAVAVEAVAEGPCILVEGVDGGEPVRVPVPADVGKVRVVTVEGQTFEVCGAVGEAWVYRAVRS